MSANDIFPFTIYFWLLSKIFRVDFETLKGIHYDLNLKANDSSLTDKFNQIDALID
jgi:hypothetical protein